MPSHVVMRMNDASGAPRGSSRAFSYQGDLHQCMAWVAKQSHPERYAIRQTRKSRTESSRRGESHGLE